MKEGHPYETKGMHYQMFLRDLSVLYDMKPWQVIAKNTVQMVSLNIYDVSGTVLSTFRSA